MTLKVQVYAPNPQFSLKSGAKDAALAQYQPVFDMLSPAVLADCRFTTENFTVVIDSGATYLRIKVTDDYDVMVTEPNEVAMLGGGDPVWCVWHGNPGMAEFDYVEFPKDAGQAVIDKVVELVAKGVV